MKTCISTYSFWRMMRDGWTMFDVIDKVKELGADGVEFVLDDSVPEGETLEERAVKLAEYARGIGLETPIYTTGANFFQKDPAAEIKRVERHVDAASEAGIKLMRHDITAGFYAGYEGLQTFDAVLPTVSAAIREVASYAQSKGVTTCSENHGRLVQDSDRMLAVFNAVAHPNYKYLCDIGNFGGVDEDCAKAVSKLLPFIAHVHAKDCFWRSGKERDPGFGWGRTRAGNYRRATIYGQGDVPVFQILYNIRSSGYDGFVSLEFEGIEENVLGVTQSFANLKRDIAEINSVFDK
ncbi:MAG: sugar phosphate isomerase/epimerase [Clostridia bacterium]|nr:sugar phosphate isomerase/epimerase [Clostridia bacterium]MBR5031562.1 sugar phosphate isomerase/epimerase [Clostridia bacterium]